MPWHNITRHPQINKKITGQRPRFGLWLWKRTLLQLLQQLAKVSGRGVDKRRPPAEQTVALCCSEGFPGSGRNPQKHWKVEGCICPGGVWQKGPGPKPTPNKQIYWWTSQGLNSQDPELLLGSNQMSGPHCNQMSGPHWHVRGWDPGWTEGSRCGWGEPSDTEEGGEGDPHQHSFLDAQFPGTPKRDHSWLSKGECGLVCSEPYALLQHTSHHCKVVAKCTGCGKDKHESQCEGPKLCSNCNGPHASSAKDCPVWQKGKEIQRVRVEKCISFPEARQLVKAKMPTVITGGKTYAAAASTRRESKSVLCQTSLTWVFLDRPLRTTESNIFFWRTRIGIDWNSGFLREVEDGISRRLGSMRVL